MEASHGQRFCVSVPEVFALRFLMISPRPIPSGPDLLGGCFLTMSTHGTDQYLVQRYLCTDRPRRAVIALLTSGAICWSAVHWLLFIGVLLFAFSPLQIQLRNCNIDSISFSGGDRVFRFHNPTFPSWIVRGWLLRQYSRPQCLHHSTQSRPRPLMISTSLSSQTAKTSII